MFFLVFFSLSSLVYIDIHDAEVFVSYFRSITITLICTEEGDVSDARYKGFKSDVLHPAIFVSGTSYHVKYMSLLKNKRSGNI